MYETHWGLRESPFPASHDLKYFFESPVHNEALARLDFLVEHGRCLGLLLGERGSGKSLLLEHFRGQLKRQGCQVAAINLLGLETTEFLWNLAVELGSNPRTGQSRLALWREISDMLVANRYQQLRTVLLLDDADHADSEVLDHVLKLMQIDPSPSARLTMILSAEPNRVDRLGGDLLQRAELRAELLPWDQDDTSDYLIRSITKAGRQTPVFDQPATERLHELCQGIPQQISQLAELALLAAAGQNLQQIDQNTVEAVYQELLGNI